MSKKSVFGSLEISIQQDLKVDDIITSLLSELDDKRIVAFIQELDKRASNWDITLSLVKYFDAEQAKYIDELEEEIDG